MTVVNPFLEDSIEQKVSNIKQAIEKALKGVSVSIPGVPCRGSLTVLPPFQHPPKKGLASSEGRGRLLHDLANIELQAMELGLRTLYEFPEAPAALKEELADLTLSEARHLQMCIESLHQLGFDFGHWPVHMALWQAVSAEDTLIDRMFIVHRYLEGSGLDAQDTLLRRLEGVSDRGTYLVLKQIHKEEIDHVYFGSRWYKELLQQEKIDPMTDLKSRLQKLRERLPKRIEPICHKWRLQSGFSPEEIEILEGFRQSWF